MVHAEGARSEVSSRFARRYVRSVSTVEVRHASISRLHQACVLCRPKESELHGFAIDRCISETSYGVIL